MLAVLENDTGLEAALRGAELRYIKLGSGNAWAGQALEAGEIHLGHLAVPHELALTGDRDAITAHLVEQGRSPAKARDFAREIADFYTLPQDTVWITFAEGQLWWAQAHSDVTWLGVGEGHGARMRRTRAPWRNTNIAGQTLTQAALSTRLTKVAAYRQTLCGVEADAYLRRKLLGEEDPLVTRALAVRGEAVEAASSLITALHWADFETLVDLLLARGGWHRTSALGGTMKDADLLVEQPVTGETALVQVKSAASQATLEDYVARFDADPALSRLIFVCHSPRGQLTRPDRSDVTLWTREGLAEAALQAGLLDWLIARSG
ncbi:MAG TPA: hypothetical protein VIL09_03430 [Microvirga sp.]